MFIFVFCKSTDDNKVTPVAIVTENHKQVPEHKADQYYMLYYRHPARNNYC